MGSIEVIVGDSPPENSKPIESYVPHPDAELDAMSLCAGALGALNETERFRVLSWINARYGKRAK